MSKRILHTPVSYEDVADLKAGDIVYVTGHVTTCRDVAHRRVVAQGMELPISIKDGAIIHAGPIVREKEDGSYEMVSIGPTTSMRMEKYEYDFVKETGVRLLIGKGGMGPNTERTCKEFGCLHLVFPAGNAVLAAAEVEEIEDANWKDLGMPETLWTSRVKEFGPLIISIDTKGNNWFANKRKEYDAKKEEVLESIYAQVKFIK